MKIILFQNNWHVLSMIVIIFTLISTFLQNKILIQVLKLEKCKVYKTYLIQTAIISLIRILLPIPYYKIIETVARIIIYKKILGLRIEKVLVAESLCVISYTILELICIKVYEEIYQIFSFAKAIENLGFVCSVAITIIFIQTAIYTIFIKFNFIIDMPEYISKEYKNQIVEITTISIILIIFDEIMVFRCIRSIPNSIYLLDIIFLLTYYIIINKSIIKILQIEKMKNERNDLEGKNERLLKNYDDMASFRHDFKNIMQGFGGFIATRDIDGLQKMYNDVVCECKEIDNNHSFNRELINNPAIYNLINNKYLEAKKFGIEIKLEVYIDFNVLKITTYELCRILGVFLDNAIEASKECNEKIINIKFINDNCNNRNLVVIENTCRNFLIDMNQIKSKGFTTKKNKLFHGLGLWRVNQIVKKNENLRLYTSRGKMFKQQLEIYTWN